VVGRAPIEDLLDAAHWRHRLEVLAERHGVPGAALGILRLGEDGGADELVEAAYGVLNVDTGVAATTDSVFQIGSISKVWTATVVQQLADEGKLELDAPIVKVLPDLVMSDPEATAKVTMRHLLTHTSGIDGDVFTDTGRGHDCIERYVAGLSDVAQIYPPGATWSYCNTGFVVAGRVIEKLTGGTWDAAIRDRIIIPLGLRRTGTLPEEALLHRAATGHTAGRATPVWTLPRSIGPAGLIHSTAAELLGFARLHLTGGLAPDRTRVLSEPGAAAMAAHQTDVPAEYHGADSWGLGWMRSDWDGRRLLGHNGGTIGQTAFLRVLPEQALAVALLTNVESDTAVHLYQALIGEIFADLAGLTAPRPPSPPEPPPYVDITPHLGAYERAGTRIEVLDDEEGPRLRMTLTGAVAELVPDPTVIDNAMVPVADGLFLVPQRDSSSYLPVRFYRLSTGERYVHLAGRAAPAAD
jgi:CubicO group peptidase (beta-lactamase class C family)